MEMVLAIKGYSYDKTYRFFNVDETNQLSMLGEMVIDYPYAIEHKIRVIRYADRKWSIDPLIKEIRATQEPWVSVGNDDGDKCMMLNLYPCGTKLRLMYICICICTKLYKYVCVCMGACKVLCAYISMCRIACVKERLATIH